MGGEVEKEELAEEGRGVWVCNRGYWREENDEIKESRKREQEQEKKKKREQKTRDRGEKSDTSLHVQGGSVKDAFRCATDTLRNDPISPYSN